jgi:GTP cyclohydrolase I
MTQESSIREARPPDRKKAERAIRDLLSALGLDPRHRALRETPRRGAGVFIDLLTAGYRTSPAEALGKGFPVASSDPVAVTHIPALLMCPHHLTPARGMAHVAFVPERRVPGLARIPRLVDALAHRLVLQEDLGRWIVDALAEHFSVRAAVAIIEAQHDCVAVEDPARRDAIVRTRATLGSRDDVASLDAEIDASLSRRWTSASAQRIGASRSRSR